MSLARRIDRLSKAVGRRDRADYAYRLTVAAATRTTPPSSPDGIPLTADEIFTALFRVQREGLLLSDEPSINEFA